MTPQPIRFEDGAGYERMMGTWSRIVGDIFLDWLAPPQGLRWIDVGCGNGAFSERIVERCAPAEVQGVDPSEAQLAYARTRPAGKTAQFHLGHAMALPFENKTFDAAVMGLVIFFVPEPAKGVAEMARVVKPGGIVASYAWDVPGGGFPLDAVWTSLSEAGVPFPKPPSAEASRMDRLRELWTGAGLVDVETREIPAQRMFASFDEFWSITRESSSTAPVLASLSADRAEALKNAVRAKLKIGADGRVTGEARENAIRGRMRS